MSTCPHDESVECNNCAREQEKKRLLFVLACCGGFWAFGSKKNSPACSIRQAMCSRFAAERQAHK